MQTLTLASDSTAARGRFVRSRRADLSELYDIYVRRSEQPFHLDIAGPEPQMTFAGFREYIGDLRRLWVLRSGGRLSGCALLADLEPGLEMATIDLTFFDSAPAPHTTSARSLAQLLARLWKRNGITRFELLALPEDHAKLELVRSLGFVEEGRLRQQFFFKNAWHDLVYLALLMGVRNAP